VTSKAASGVVSKQSSPLKSVVTPAPGKTVPHHLSWLVPTGTVHKTSDGRSVQVLELNHRDDSDVLSAWAKHFRNQYCDDNQIDVLRAGMKLSRAEYLKKIKFPDSSVAPGPSIRAGDFGEILVSDYLEFALDYWIPRTRYDHKVVRNESTKGSDIIGIKVIDPGRDDPNDVLAIFEAKAQLTGSKPNNRLQAAVDDSVKDELRKAESLNAIKQRFLDSGRPVDVARIERFQDLEDRPYKEEYGAVALLSTGVFDPKEIGATSVSSHPNSGSLILIVIHGADLMDLVHDLYQRAADEA
jgi:hypothetical protein